MLYADYNYITEQDVTYTIDMLRIRCDITNNEYEILVARLRTIYNDQIENFYISTRS